jgi:hypothetical protein
MRIYISMNELLMVELIDDLCPICINKKAECYTECQHAYCIDCLSKIHTCAMCRKTLIHNKLCREIVNSNRIQEPYVRQIYTLQELNNIRQTQIANTHIYQRYYFNRMMRQELLYRGLNQL